MGEAVEDQEVLDTVVQEAAEVVVQGAMVAVEDLEDEEEAVVDMEAVVEEDMAAEVVVMAAEEGLEVVEVMALLEEENSELQNLTQK